jgi:hypothetical protein
MYVQTKKYRVIRYWLNDKEKRTSIDSFPEVTLHETRMKNMEFRKSLESGKPLGIRKFSCLRQSGRAG